MKSIKEVLQEVVDGKGNYPKEVRENLKAGIEAGKIEQHKTHGRGDLSGPDVPDCPCRGTPAQVECGQFGCGFCAPNPQLLPYTLGD